jgi:hypothetical protein
VYTLINSEWRIGQTHDTAHTGVRGMAEEVMAEHQNVTKLPRLTEGTHYAFMQDFTVSIFQISLYHTKLWYRISAADTPNAVIDFPACIQMPFCH